MSVLSIREKWRPNLSTVIALVVTILITLPLIGLFAARLSSNQFVRETESSLIAQAAVFAEIYAFEYRRLSDGPLHGVKLSPQQKEIFAQKFHPKHAALTTKANTILSERPDPFDTALKVGKIHHEIGRKLTLIASKAQQTSLAGYQALDHQGLVIGGTGNVSGSFAGIKEVEAALKGERASILRYRAKDNQRQALNSISRDTGFRVFVTLPVIVDDHVVGAVYLARTPSNLGKFLFRERATLGWIASSIIFTAFLVGFVLWRLLVGPLRKLQIQSEEIAKGKLEKAGALEHYGTKETVSLGRSFLSMSEKLNQRSESLQSYTAHVTHELKSPLTSITGAVELLEQSSDRMSNKDRAKFYRNINDDTARMVALLDDLRSYAAADMGSHEGQCNIRDEVLKIASASDDLNVTFKGDETAIAPLAQDDLGVVLTQLATNAAQHGASHMIVHSTSDGFTISDDGTGIDPNLTHQIFDPFFTTNRDKGGTGMGLAILRNIIATSGGAIKAIPSNEGAVFNVSWKSS